MEQHTCAGIRNKLRPLSFSLLVMHVTFFWIRLFCISVIVLKAQKNKLSESRTEEQYKFRSEVLNEIVFLSNFNLFQLYQEVSTFVSGNLYEYYLSIAAMAHNAVLSMFILATAGIHLPNIYWVVFISFSCAFLAEMTLSLYVTYARRFEYNLEIFKKVGASPSINSAFATRKFLQTFGASKIFLSFVIMGRDLIPPRVVFDKISCMIIGFGALTCAQQLFVSVNFNDENMAQRKIAISLSFVRLPLIVIIAVWCVVLPKSTDQVMSTYVTAFIFVDIMVISVISDYILLSDTRQFGSGLKKFLSFRIERSILSS